MSIYFVSDFHLGEGDAQSERRKHELFRRFVGRVGADLQQLVVLGDLFHFWFEYRQLIPKRNLHVLFELRDLVQRGVSVSYVTGNHDFWMDDFMERELDIQVFRDILELDTRQGKILATHGDGLLPSDRGYRLLRAVLRHPVNIALYRLLPPSLAYGLARGAARLSRRHSAARPEESFLERYRDAARRKLDDGYFAFVCGHTHLPEIKRYDEKYYVNSGDWFRHFTYVRFGDGRFAMQIVPGRIDRDEAASFETPTTVVRCHQPGATFRRDTAVGQREPDAVIGV
jgi:UDP-2,3-diacylglucosamine hydrolase